jgi:hypothetical protein
MRARRNSISKTKPSAEQIEEMRLLGEEIKKYESKQDELSQELRVMWLKIPNFTHPVLLYLHLKVPLKFPNLIMFLLLELMRMHYNKKQVVLQIYGNH